jgi:uncharacterized integral membrane protein
MGRDRRTQAHLGIVVLLTPAHHPLVIMLLACVMLGYLLAVILKVARS